MNEIHTAFHHHANCSSSPVPQAHQSILQGVVSTFGIEVRLIRDLGKATGLGCADRERPSHYR